MSILTKLTIGGTDCTTDFDLQALRVTAPGYGGVVSTASLRVTHRGGGGALNALMTAGAEVKLWDYDSVTGFIDHRWFGGLLANSKPMPIYGNSVWQLDCVGYDSLLDSIILDDGALHGTIVNTKFKTQIERVMGFFVPGFSRNLDYATTSVPDYNPGTLLGHTSWQDFSPRTALQKVCDTLQATGALGPSGLPRAIRFTLLPPTDGSSTFGEPQLIIWDANDSTIITYQFSDAPDNITTFPILQRNERTLTGSQVWTARVAQGAPGIRQRYEDTTATAVYRNAWAPNGCFSQGPLTNTAWRTTADALAAATADVLNHHAMLESWQFTTTKRGVTPGTFAAIYDSFQGVSGTVYPVAQVDIDFSDPQQPLSTVTLGARQPRYGDPTATASRTPIVLGPGTIPDAPTALTATGNTYQPPTHDVTVTMTWVAPVYPDIAWCYVRATYGGVYHWSPRLDGDPLTYAWPGLPVATAVVFEVQAFNSYGLGSAFSAPLSLTTAAAVAPDPPASAPTVQSNKYNPLIRKTQIAIRSVNSVSASATQHRLRVVSSGYTQVTPWIPLDGVHAYTDFPLMNVAKGSTVVVDAQSADAYGDQSAWGTSYSFTAASGVDSRPAGFEGQDAESGDTGGAQILGWNLDPASLVGAATADWSATGYNGLHALKLKVPNTATASISYRSDPVALVSGMSYQAWVAWKGTGANGTATLKAECYNAAAALVGTVTIWTATATTSWVEIPDPSAQWTPTGTLPVYYCIVLQFTRTSAANDLYISMDPERWRPVITAASLAAGVGAGTVTSVALTAPAEITVGGTPITTAGTLALTFTSQAANKVLAAPSGGAGALTARLLVAADLPAGVPTSFVSINKWSTD